MNLIIALGPLEELRLSDAARQIGLAPAEYVKQLVRQHLPPEVGIAGEQDPTLALLERWKAEDAEITPEELKAERESWEQFKANIDAEREAAGARTLF